MNSWPGQEKEARSDFAPLPFQEDEGWTKGINYSLSYPIFGTGPENFPKEDRDAKILSIQDIPNARMAF